MAVFVLDKHKQPLMPCSEKRARLLLERGRARVHRLTPFIIRLVDRTVEHSVWQPLRLKLDPGSKTTGMALVREREGGPPLSGGLNGEAPSDPPGGRQLTVLMLLELHHRGPAIRNALTRRRAWRRRRRGNLRYRPARFNNRTRPDGWLAPSLQHRVDTTLAWVRRLRRYAPITALAQELVRFDTQVMQNPEISGVEYQQGTLVGYEVREYLLEKWERQCAYCGAKEVPLEVEHIMPRSHGGSHRVSNLTLACHACNQRKDHQPLWQFLSDRPELAQKISAQALAPLRDAAAVNSTRWALYRALQTTGLPVEVGTGGRTKYNRQRLHIPKDHGLDAVCVGPVGTVRRWHQPVLSITATGRGGYQRTRVTKYGFPRGYLTRSKSAFGFQTGDMVRAIVTTGKKVGEYLGRVAIRARGSFNIQTGTAVIQGVSHRFCTRIQRADGYGYSLTKIASEKGEVGMGPAEPAALSLPGLNAGVSRTIG